MKPIVIIIICILAFSPITDAREYFFQLHSGFTLKVVTPDDTELLQAINSGVSINVTITSNNPQQEMLDYNTGHSLLTHLLPEAIGLYQEGSGGQVVHSGTVMVLQQPYVVESSSALSAQVLSRGACSSSADTSQSTKCKTKQVVRTVHINSQGKKSYLCLFPECNQTFSNHVLRSRHHNSHFGDGFFTGDEKKPCPLCNIYFAANLASMMIHMSLNHRTQ